jgi:hypothetical protein
MEFLGPEYADPAWLAQASTIPRTPSSNWRTLPIDQQQRLTEVSRPGLALLGYL